jgi:hypothetical protein
MPEKEVVTNVFWEKKGKEYHCDGINSNLQHSQAQKTN